MKNLATAILLFLVLTVLTGLVYPAILTVISLGLFPGKAGGSLVKVNGVIVGSRLIGQNFPSAKYFWPRPSASNYNPLPSSGSNLGPTSAALKQQVEQRKAELSPWFSTVPAELLLASASGLDPHLSPEAALAQVDRAAGARGLSAQQKEQLIALVNQETEPPQWRIFGSSRVNVLELNLALDRLFERGKGAEP